MAVSYHCGVETANVHIRNRTNGERPRFPAVTDAVAYAILHAGCSASGCGRIDEFGAGIGFVKLCMLVMRF